jgi:hypothetical protein
MKKVICLLLIGLLFSVFGLESDAFAKSKKLILTNTEWLIQGTGKMYDCDGNYLGSMIGSVGLGQFGEPASASSDGTGATGTIAPVVVTNPEGPPAQVVTGSVGVYYLESYTLKKNTATATSGNVCIETSSDEIIEEYPEGACGGNGDFGPMNAVFKFTKKGTFTGVIKYTIGDCPGLGMQNIISVSGRLLGEFPDLAP